MPQDFSFDVVSEVNLQEVDNAINQAIKELRTRYDFKGTKCDIQFSREKASVTLLADNDLHHKSLTEMIHTKLAKRGVSVKSLKYSTAEKALDGMLRQTAEVQQGIPQERSKELVKSIKALKLKVQASIQGDHIRVAGRAKDDLQTVMEMLRSQKVADLPLQFVNYR
jgi:cyclic-di-GMP-binding protein